MIKLRWYPCDGFTFPLFPVLTKVLGAVANSPNQFFAEKHKSDFYKKNVYAKGYLKILIYIFFI